MTVNDFAKQQSAAIAELRREAAELVPGIGLRQRLCLSRNDIAGEHGMPLSHTTTTTED